MCFVLYILKYTIKKQRSNNTPVVLVAKAIPVFTHGFTIYITLAVSALC